MGTTDDNAEALTRRELLARAGTGAACLAAASALPWPAEAMAQSAGGAAPASAPGDGPPEAMFYEKLKDSAVRCGICPRACEVPQGKRGWCGVRLNKDGSYRTLVYGKACALHLDPIEKKPFYHYLPGTPALSLATVGCNFACKFCQNWDISQARPEDVDAADLPPDKLVELAQKSKAASLAFTYSEPTVFYEYMHDSAKAARAAGIGGCMVSNGFMAEKPLRQLCRHLTAVKVDFKGFNETFYREVCSGQLKPVLATLALCGKLGIHLEIVTLLIPTLNDQEDVLKDMAKWIGDNLGPDVPLHFTRFTPMYKLKNLSATPVATLEKARDIARQAGLHYVYVGNVGVHEGGHTYCHKCNALLIRRAGYVIKENALAGRTTCPKCDTPIPGIWSAKQALEQKLHTDTEPATRSSQEHA